MKKSELYKIVKEELQKELEEQRRNRRTRRPARSRRPERPERLDRETAERLNRIARRFKLDPDELIKISSSKGIPLNKLVNFNEKDIIDLIDLDDTPQGGGTGAGGATGCSPNFAGYNETFFSYNQSTCDQFEINDHFACCGVNNDSTQPFADNGSSGDYASDQYSCYCPSPVLDGQGLLVGCNGGTANSPDVGILDSEAYNTWFAANIFAIEVAGPQPADCGCGGVQSNTNAPFADASDYQEYYTNTFDAANPIDISALTPATYNTDGNVTSFCQTTITYGCADTAANNTSTAGTYTVIDNEGICTYDTVQEVPGCTDPDANNYNELATVDDGSCEYDPDPILGCISSTACNYNPDATEDDGSCNEPVADCYECEEDADGNLTGELVIIDDDEDGICNAQDSENNIGCTDNGNMAAGYQNSLGGNGSPYQGIAACNYSDTATMDDGSCEYTSCAGCTDSTATNYDSSATIDDGSCTYGPTPSACHDVTVVRCSPRGGTDQQTLPCITIDGQAVDMDYPATSQLRMGTITLDSENSPGNTYDVPAIYRVIQATPTTGIVTDYPFGNCLNYPTDPYDPSDEIAPDLTPVDLDVVNESKEIRNSLKDEFMISEEQKLRNLIRKTLLKRKK